MIVADTDVLIDALQGRDPSVRAVEELLRDRRLATTAITLLELGVGASTGPERDRIDRLLEALPVLAFDSEAAQLAAGIGAALRTEGRPIPTADLAVAGICLHLDVPLFTRNTRHFERVEGLRLRGPG